MQVMALRPKWLLLAKKYGEWMDVLEDDRGVVSRDDRLDLMRRKKARKIPPTQL